MTRPETTRINFNATVKQKKEMVKRARQADKNLTDYIIYQTIEMDPAKEQSIELLELNYQIQNLNFQIEQHKATIEQLQADKELLRDDLEDTRRLYQEANRVVQWHSLGWFKKMITKQLDNK